MMKWLHDRSAGGLKRYGSRPGRELGGISFTLDAATPSSCIQRPPGEITGGELVCHGPIATG